MEPLARRSQGGEASLSRDASLGLPACPPTPIHPPIHPHPCPLRKRAPPLLLCPGPGAAGVGLYPPLEVASRARLHALPRRRIHHTTPATQTPNPPTHHSTRTYRRPWLYQPSCRRLPSSWAGARRWPPLPNPWPPAPPPPPTSLPLSCPRAGPAASSTCPPRSVSSTHPPTHPFTYPKALARARHPSAKGPRGMASLRTLQQALR